MSKLVVEKCSNYSIVDAFLHVRRLDVLLWYCFRLLLPLLAGFSSFNALKFEE